MGNIVGIDSGKKDYVINIGGLTFPYSTALEHDNLAAYFQQKVELNKPFIINLNDDNGPRCVLNPSPGMAIIIMTKEQFEKNRFLSQMIQRGNNHG